MRDLNTKAAAAPSSTTAKKLQKKARDSPAKTTSKAASKAGTRRITMIKEAITSLAARGFTRQSIIKYAIENSWMPDGLSETQFGSQIKRALQKGLDDGVLRKKPGTGTSQFVSIAPKVAEDKSKRSTLAKEKENARTSDGGDKKTKNAKLRTVATGNAKAAAKTKGGVTKKKAGAAAKVSQAKKDSGKKLRSAPTPDLGRPQRQD